MNKEAAMRWKRRFAQELLEIRRRVIADKLLAVQAETLTPRVRSTKQRKHFYRKEARERPLLGETGTSKSFSGSSFARDLRQWWVTQTQFRRQADLAAALRVDGETVSSWLGSKKFPKRRQCDKIFGLSGLGCFSPEGRNAARREHESNRRAKKVQR